MLVILALPVSSPCLEGGPLGIGGWRMFHSGRGRVRRGLASAVAEGSSSLSFLGWMDESEDEEGQVASQMLQDGG